MQLITKNKAKSHLIQTINLNYIQESKVSDRDIEIPVQIYQNDIRDQYIREENLLTQ